MRLSCCLLLFLGAVSRQGVACACVRARVPSPCQYSTVLPSREGGCVPWLRPTRRRTLAALPLWAYSQPILHLFACQTMLALALLTCGFVLLDQHIYPVLAKIDGDSQHVLHVCWGCTSLCNGLWWLSLPLPLPLPLPLLHT
jgi:hypothetical protein